MHPSVHLLNETFIEEILKLKKKMPYMLSKMLNY